jgi:alkaline phosphatase D
MARKDIDIFFLDERFNRQPLPCYMRREWCETVVLIDSNHRKYGWCNDFLHGGVDNEGSCCKLDELIYFGYCKQANAVDDPLYSIACDISSEEFGSIPIRLDATLNVLTRDGIYGDHTGSSFCEVLGRPQREWLKTALRESDAAVKIVLSGSVLLALPNFDSDGTNGMKICSGDDWDCYEVARNDLIRLLLSEDVEAGRQPQNDKNENEDEKKEGKTSVRSRCSPFGKLVVVEHTDIIT